MMNGPIDMSGERVNMPPTDGLQVIPEAAVEAAAKAAWDAMGGRLWWKTLGDDRRGALLAQARAALEAAAPHIKKQALDDAALETLRRGDVGKDGGIKVDVFLMWRARQEAGTAPWGVGK